MQRSESLFEPGRVAHSLLGFYALASLTSMAGMSVGIGLVLIGVLTGLGLSSAFRAQFLFSARSAFQARSVKTLLFLTLFLVLSLVASLISYQVAPVRLLQDEDKVAVSRDLGKLLYFVFPFLWVTLFGMLSQARKKQVLGVWCFSGGALGVFAIFQFFTGFPRPQPIPTSPQFFHATLLFGHHLSTASILIFPAFVALALAQATAGSSHLHAALWRFLMSSRFWVLCGVGAFLALFLSFSRMAWIAIPMGLCLLMLRRFEFRKLSAARVGIGFVFVVLGALVLWQTPALQERVRNPMGIATRLELWKWNLELFQERPIFGIGWRRSEVFAHALVKERFPDPEMRRQIFVGHAHNNWIEMLSGTGVLGLLAWCLYAFFPIWVGWRDRRVESWMGALSWGLICAWIVFLLNGLTQVNFWEGKVMHQWAFGLGLFLVTRVELEKRGGV